jgi:CheY-like chemotaxis protein
MTLPDSKTVLIVEDNEDDAKLLQLLLASAGIANPTHVVLSAEEAITYLQGAPPYSNRTVNPIPVIVFVDLKLPGIDGFELLRWLRACNELKSIFVVVLSATGDIISVQAAYALGANSFLVKPCRAPDLENLVACYPAFWVHSTPPVATPSHEGQHPI